MQSYFKNLGENSPQKPNFIGLQKLAVGSQISLSVDRPVDRPTVRILTVEPAVDRPVDRGTGAESRSSLRSTGSVDRPSSRPGVHVLCMSVDRLGRLTSSSVDRSGRPAEARELNSGNENVDILIEIKSHKFTKNLQK